MSIEKEVVVRFGPTLEFARRAHEERDPAQARAWFDAEFTRLEAEPLRASGKVLTADKVLAVAVAAGAREFSENAPWATDYVENACAALGRPTIRIEVDSMSLSF